jgi:UDP-2,3-diacylglucosamine pyrophosphatase LpxH
MSRLAREGRLYYVIGNHDHDISFYRDILNFRVCDELRLGDRVLVQHGYEYDEYIGNDLAGSHLATKVHHLVERYLNTWIRIPLGEFYTLGGRISAWLLHKVGVLLWLGGLVLSQVGNDWLLAAVRRRFDYIARSNAGDPMCIFRPAWRRLREGPYAALVCGHSHLPGVVRAGDKAFVNTGSWTFGSSNYVVWDGEGFECRDWMSGRPFGDEFYQPMLDGSLDELDFWTWWSSEYMGWLRFRTGEERAGRLRNWESHVKDRQSFSHLEPVRASVAALARPGDVDKVAK